LTSFPFRIIDANNAYKKLTGKNVVGESFYDVFVTEGPQVPSIATCPTLFHGKFDEDLVRVSSDFHENGHFCKIQVRPVLRNKTEQPSDDLGALRYYTITLKELKVPTTDAPCSAVVYLPMPCGSMRR
jgi:hypothetical protein